MCNNVFVTAENVISSHFRSKSPVLNMEVDPVMEAQEREREMMMELQVRLEL